MNKYLVVILALWLNFVNAQNEAVDKFKFLKKIDNINYLNDANNKSSIDSLQLIIDNNSNDTIKGYFYRIQAKFLINQLEYDAALKSLDKSIAFYKNANNSIGIIKSMMNKGGVLYQKGETKNATQEYVNALAIAEKKGYKNEIAALYKNIGLVYYSQGKTKEALTYNNKALAIFNQLKSKKDIAATYVNIGNCYFDDYQPQNALLNYNKALKLSKETNDNQTIAKLYNNIGSVYINDLQDTIKGIDYLLDALAIKKQMNNQNDLIIQYNNIAAVYLDIKKYDLALSYNDKAFELASKSGNLEELINVYDTYALINSAKKDFKKAYDYHKLYSKTKDSLLNIDNLKAVEEINTKYQTAEKEKQLLQKEAEAKKKTTTIIILSLLALFIAIVGFLIYRQQRLKNVQQKQEFELQSAIAQIENQNKLHEQRLAISRDLHDNIGAQLTFIISSVENLKFGFPTMENSIKNHLTKISDFTKTTIVELRDTIWAMNANEFTFDDLSSRIYNFIEKAQSAKESTTFKFTVDESLKNSKFSSLEGVNLYRTIQEAVNNAIKYADANEVSIQVQPIENGITIEISDNGKGFDLDTIDLGNGIVNMQKRIEEIGGVFKIQSELDKGTQITISLNK
ncbi:tetratricopeptide repeat-containing sensor histidine kinase [Flavobacterium celericrescens]|uniref:histidine kinase n=1 Tax=Flavobacterium celericrescens TaxID=2709780 RepID=A0ABX0IGV3_9FLAO|nr:sensor histidine kinase [Flavobacterium celericrescens]NHM04516.1 tetratricopeptide repeat protein [Flavobacterium celericrescens]